MSFSIEKHLQEDFLEEYHNYKVEIRALLLQLEKAPEDIQAVRALFRTVHSVKSNLHMIGLADLGKLIHKLEDLLNAVRSGEIEFSQLISDLILLNLEAIERMFTKAFDDEDIQIELMVYTKALSTLSTTSTVEQGIVDAIKVFDPDYVCDTLLDNAETTDDKLLFENLAHAMEQRVIGKQGSTQRIVEIALAMNAIAGNPIDSIQLRAAALMHDVAMAFLPLKILNKKERYDDKERQRLYNHPKEAADILLGLEKWQEASEMVSQHHERVDGKGYPNQLSGDKICAGAKLLSIVDTFDSMSHQRADREHRRSVIRIVAEVNACKDQQFDNFWVKIFNQYIRQHYLK